MIYSPEDRIYYAQNREDLILESFFCDRKNGFYVDVGACHPDVASVTKRFYNKGWNGINIEPQTNLHGLFVRDRKRDVNLNLGISDEHGTVVLRTYVNNGGLSTAAIELKDEYEKKGGNRTEEYNDVAIKVTTLETVLTQYKVKSIQFLKVDVEGFEYEVLNGNNWLQFRPEVICIESNHIVKDWRPLLTSNNYEKVFFDGLNEYYVDSMGDRAKKFNFVDHVIMGLKGGVAADDYDQLKKVISKNVNLTKIIEEYKQRSNSDAKELQSIKKTLKRVIQLTLSRAEYSYKKASMILHKKRRISKK